MVMWHLLQGLYGVWTPLAATWVKRFGNFSTDSFEFPTE